MQIHQVSATYDPRQDRILLRVNTVEQAELRLWLTRRLLQALWPLLIRQLAALNLHADAGPGSDAEATRRMLADFRNEQVLQSADFETPFRDDGAHLPLGNEPLLVTDVDIQTSPDAPICLRFTERADAPATARSCQLDIEPLLLQGVKLLLEQVLAQSQWREPFDPASAADGAADPVEAADRPPRRYLN